MAMDRNGTGRGRRSFRQDRGRRGRGRGYRSCVLLAAYQCCGIHAFKRSQSPGHQARKHALNCRRKSQDRRFWVSDVVRVQRGHQALDNFCGSPPYIAPEVISCSNRRQVKGAGYRPDLVDIWSCGIVLFVLLAGNTPWDSPTDSSYEFHEYLATNARTSDELWQKLPAATLSLLRGMLNVDPSNRFSLEDVRRHPWFTRQNRYLALDGKLRDPINLATTMFESLHIDFSQDPLSRPHRTSSFDPEQMRFDDGDLNTEPRISSTQPEMPRAEMLVDWDTPHTADVFSSTQPTGRPSSSDDMLLASYLEDEPSMSQFSPHPSVPLSRTQKAQRFRDIVPARPMTRFFSTWELKILVPLVCELSTAWGFLFLVCPRFLQETHLQRSESSLEMAECAHCRGK